jgi:hypothetical protein
MFQDNLPVPKLRYKTTCCVTHQKSADLIYNFICLCWFKWFKSASTLSDLKLISFQDSFETLFAAHILNVPGFTNYISICRVISALSFQSAPSLIISTITQLYVLTLLLAFWPCSLAVLLCTSLLLSQYLFHDLLAFWFWIVSGDGLFMSPSHWFIWPF